MKIFVTGATGFIGSHLVDELLKENHSITVYARKSSSLKFLPKDKINIAYGDIKDPNRLKEALVGFDVVYHNAALASDWAPKNEFYETNLGGTKNVLLAMRENKIKKLIFTSTIGVIGEENCSTAKNEASPYKPRINYFLSSLFEPDMNHYRMSKMLAEKETIEFAKKHAIALTVIRPTWVYGPREFHSGGYYICRAILDGMPLFPFGKTNRFHLIYVKDLVKAMAVVLKKDLTGINIFIIGNEYPPLAKEYIENYAKSLGAKAPKSIPEGFFQPVGFILEALYKLLRKKNAPLLTRARVKMLYCNNIYDVSKAENELGFIAQTPLAQGIEDTVRWWKENQYLKG